MTRLGRLAGRLASFPSVLPYPHARGPGRSRVHSSMDERGSSKPCVCGFESCWMHQVSEAQQDVQGGPNAKGVSSNLTGDAKINLDTTPIRVLRY